MLVGETLSKPTGFDFVEAYPNKAFKSDADDYMGPAETFKEMGYNLYHETAE